MIKKLVLGSLALIALLAAYLLLWPVPVDPVPWPAPAPPGYAGPHAANERLKSLTLIPLQGESGPEHVAFGPDGKLYAAMASGKLLRMAADGSQQETFADTGGRVLGFAFDATGRLIAADAIKGLLAVAPDRKVSVLADQADGAPIRYADAVVVAKNGLIYLSDASMRFGPRESGSTYEAAVLDIIEQRCSGRILVHDPAGKTTRTMIGGLCFANGVALSDDEQHLFVAETGNYRVWKVSIGAMGLDIRQPSPQAKLLFDNLPGYPDNLMLWPERPPLARLLGPAQPQGRRDGAHALAAQPHAAPAARAVAGAQALRPRDGLRRIGPRAGRPAGPERRLPADHRRHRDAGAPVHPEPAQHRAGLDAQKPSRPRLRVH